jgi:hypothetical protein
LRIAVWTGDTRDTRPEAEESYCVMVAGAAFLCSGHVFLLPTKGKRSIEEDREQIDRDHNTESVLCRLAQALLIA